MNRFSIALEGSPPSAEIFGSFNLRELLDELDRLHIDAGSVELHIEDSGHCDAIPYIAVSASPVPCGESR